MPGLTVEDEAATQANIERREALRIWLRLLAGSNAIEREIQTRLREGFGVSLARFDFLAQLERSDDGEMTMTELSQKLMVSGGNITGLTDRLSKEGLVERRAHPGDRRRCSGSRLLVRAKRFSLKWQTSIPSGCPKSWVVWKALTAALCYMLLRRLRSRLTRPQNCVLAKAAVSNNEQITNQ